MTIPPEAVAMSIVEDGSIESSLMILEALRLLVYIYIQYYLQLHV